MVTTHPSSTSPLAGWKLALHVPTPADWKVGGTPRPGTGTVAGATSATPARSTADSGGASPELAPWQRVDAAWPTIANSPSGLDGDAQKLVRRLLTQAAGQRLARRHDLEADRLWMWQPQPGLADYTRQRRFYAPGLGRFHPLDVWEALRKEAALALEVIATPPGALGGAEVWQELVALQCQRIGQLHAELQRRLGAARALATLQGMLEALT